PTDALSVWIGKNAVLDAAGRAYTALDLQGTPYGVVLDGGSILLGGPGGKDPNSSGVLSSSTYVVVRSAARAHASGTSAMVGVGSNGNLIVREVASDGGSIAINSYQSFIIDDLLREDGSYVAALRANAGGAGASGGSLSLTLEAPLYKGPFPIDPMTRT